MTPTLWMSGLRKRFSARELWQPVELTVAAGETVALLGANGSGKSTLLRIAATVSRPSAGSVVVDGLDALRRPDAARGRLGFQAQDAPLYAELSPHEHLRWWARLHGADVNADALALRWGLDGIAHKPSAVLSRGQRQRAALALATLHHPALLLLDEPFTALDEAGRSALDAALAERRGRKATLLALHDEAEARRLADRVLRLDRTGVHPA